MLTVAEAAIELRLRSDFVVVAVVAGGAVLGFCREKTLVEHHCVA